MKIICFDPRANTGLQLYKVFLDHPEDYSVCIILNDEGTPVAAVIKESGFDIVESNGYRDLMPEGFSYSTI